MFFIGAGIGPFQKGLCQGDIPSTSVGPFSKGVGQVVGVGKDIAN